MSFKSCLFCGFFLILSLNFCVLHAEDIDPKMERQLVSFSNCMQNTFYGETNVGLIITDPKILVSWAERTIANQKKNQALDALSVYALIVLNKQPEAKELALKLLNDTPDDLSLNVLSAFLSKDAKDKEKYMTKAFEINLEKAIVLSDPSTMNNTLPLEVNLENPNADFDIYCDLILKNRFAIDKNKFSNGNIRTYIRYKLLNDWKDDLGKEKQAEELYKQLGMDWTTEKGLINSMKKGSIPMPQNPMKRKLLMRFDVKANQQSRLQIDEIKAAIKDYKAATGQLPENMEQLQKYMDENGKKFTFDNSKTTIGTEDKLLKIETDNNNLKATTLIGQ